MSYLFGIGKATALKILMGGHQPTLLGQLEADEEKISEATTFIAACYSSKVEGDVVEPGIGCEHDREVEQ